jgi:hypothetical protein
MFFCSLSGQEKRTITVRGTAEKQIAPETIDLKLIYRYTEKVEDKERSRLQEGFLLKVLEEFKILKDNLVIDDISATSAGWNSSMKIENSKIYLKKSYRLKINKPSILIDLIPRLAQSGADNISVCNLEHSKLDSIKQVTMLTAIDDAKTKGIEIAKHIGFELGNPVKIEEIYPNKSLQGDRQDQFYKFNDYQSRYGGTFEDIDFQSVNIRKIRITKSYEITYEIK